MNEEQTKGDISDLKGNLKEGLGKLTGNEQLEAEGNVQQVQGDAQRGLGDVQDTLRDDDRETR